jgi:hypothetical protein
VEVEVLAVLANQQEGSSTYFGGCPEVLGTVPADKSDVKDVAVGNGGQLGAGQVCWCGVTVPVKEI